MLAQRSLGSIAIAALMSAPLTAVADGVGDGPTIPDTHLSFQTGSALTGIELKNHNNQVLGTIDDFIVNTDNGRFVLAIVKHGGMLGIGETKVAVPFAATNWSESDGCYTLNLTPERLSRLAEFDSDEWSSLNEPSFAARVGQMLGTATERLMPDNDPFDHLFEGRETTKWSGVIDDVTRDNPEALGDDWIYVTIRDGNQTSKVVLGPAWFVMNQARFPVVGDRVEVKTIQYRPDNKKTLFIAQQFTLDDHTFSLRHHDGSGRWSSSVNTQVSPSEAPNYAFLSDLDNGQIRDSQGELFDSVSDIVVEARSGLAAYVAADVDEALEIDDDYRVLPWSALSLDDNLNYFSDQAISTLNAAPIVRGDSFSRLETARLRTQIAKYYGVQPQAFNTLSWHWSIMDLRRDSWMGDSTYNQLYGTGTDLAVSGTILRLDREPPLPGMTTGVVATLNADDGTRYLVHMGPAWFVDQQTITVSADSEVTVHGRLVSQRDDGPVFMIAREVAVEDGTITLRAKDGHPVWDARDN